MNVSGIVSHGDQDSDALASHARNRHRCLSLLWSSATDPLHSVAVRAHMTRVAQVGVDNIREYFQQNQEAMQQRNHQKLQLIKQVGMCSRGQRT